MFLRTTRKSRPVYAWILTIQFGCCLHVYVYEFITYLLDDNFIHLLFKRFFCSLFLRLEWTTHIFSFVVFGFLCQCHGYTERHDNSKKKELNSLNTIQWIYNSNRSYIFGFLFIFHYSLTSPMVALVDSSMNIAVKNVIFRDVILCFLRHETN